MLELETCLCILNAEQEISFPFYLASLKLIECTDEQKCVRQRQWNSNAINTCSQSNDLWCGRLRNFLYTSCFLRHHPWNYIWPVTAAIFVSILLILIIGSGRIGRGKGIHRQGEYTKTYQIVFYLWCHIQQSDQRHFPYVYGVDECPTYILANCQDATICTAKLVRRKLQEKR